MATQTQFGGAYAQQSQGDSRVAAKPDSLQGTPHWSFGVRLAFRFFFVYFTLYALSGQILPGLIVPGIDLPYLGGVWPLRQVTLWTAAYGFHVAGPLVYVDNGSGDKVFDWVLTFCLFIFGVVITTVWSILDRRRNNYVTLHKWFRLALRFALASAMLFYGIVKIIPEQMPFPDLFRLVKPFGNFSPMGVLWSSVGASPAYEIFAGSAETLGGILLMIPRTTTLGALVSLADLTQVFVLNMTYDVPVKLDSFHLLLFALFLLAPEARRLISFFFAECAVPLSVQPTLCRTRRANRIALVLQAVVGVYLAGMSVHVAIKAWHEWSGGRPKPSLYGIWNVEEMSIDGQIRPPLLTDSDRWRRIIFDFTETTQMQRMDESFAWYGSSINDKDRMLTLTKFQDKNWKAAFTFNRTAPDQLNLDGTMDGHKIHMQLKLFDHKKLLLVNRGFRWINEYPFNR